jgi:hypothetical protein
MVWVGVGFQGCQNGIIGLGITGMKLKYYFAEFSPSPILVTVVQPIAPECPPTAEAFGQTLATSSDSDIRMWNSNIG